MSGVSKHLRHPCPGSSAAAISIMTPMLDTPRRRQSHPGLRCYHGCQRLRKPPRVSGKHSLALHPRLLRRACDGFRVRRMSRKRENTVFKRGSAKEGLVTASLFRNSRPWRFFRIRRRQNCGPIAAMALCPSSGLPSVTIPPPVPSPKSHRKPCRALRRAVGGFESAKQLASFSMTRGHSKRASRSWSRAPFNQVDRVADEARLGREAQPGTPMPMRATSDAARLAHLRQVRRSRRVSRDSRRAGPEP